jgi:hypothetical protein
VTVLSSDRAFADFLATVRPRSEAIVWPTAHLIAHLYDEETERLRPFARPVAGQTIRKRKHRKYHFTARQLQIAAESLERQERGSRP